MVSSLLTVSERILCIRALKTILVTIVSRGFNWRLCQYFGSRRNSQYWGINLQSNSLSFFKFNQLPICIDFIYFQLKIHAWWLSFR